MISPQTLSLGVGALVVDVLDGDDAMIMEGMASQVAKWAKRILALSINL